MMRRVVMPCGSEARVAAAAEALRNALAAIRCTTTLLTESSVPGCVVALACESAVRRAEEACSMLEREGAFGDAAH